MAREWTLYPPGPNPQPPTDKGLFALIQPDPLVWLYAIDVPSTPVSKYRLSAYHETINFERDSTGAAVQYYAGSILHEDVQSDTEGSIPKVKLSCQNLTREAIALLEEYDGLIGQKVRIALVRLSEMPDGDPIDDAVYDILDSSATESTAELTLGRAALTSKQFPDRRTSRTYCAHKYGGAGCGYDTKRSGAMQTCSKLMDGATGCTAHGLDEAAASLVNRHPARMLVFLGIPRTSGVGVA